MVISDEPETYPLGKTQEISSRFRWRGYDVAMEELTRNMALRDAEILRGIIAERDVCVEALVFAQSRIRDTVVLEKIEAALNSQSTRR